MRVAMLAILSGAPTWFVVLYVVVGMVIAFGFGLAVAGEIRLRRMLRRGEITREQLAARRQARSRRRRALPPGADPSSPISQAWMYSPGNDPGALGPMAPPPPPPSAPAEPPHHHG